MKNQSLSIIIPVYNDQNGINKCLLALEKQTIDNSRFEVLIIDNASDTPIINDNKSKLDIRIINCPTKGSYAARNMGVKHANNETLIFLDADCFPAPDWLENGVTMLNHHADNVIIGGEVALINSDQATTTEQYQCLMGFGQEANIRDKKFTATANVFLSAKAFEDIGPFEEQLLSGGDREWAWRAGRKGYQVVYCKSAVVFTPPREKFMAAAKQARRVAGGRFHFKQLGLIPDQETQQNLAPHRGVWDSTIWLLRQKQLTLPLRIKILCVASLLKAVQVLENVRLQLGSSPERC